MRILRPVVKPLVRAVFDVLHDLTPGGSIRAELVGDQPSWRAALLAQETPQQALGRFGITPRLDDLIEHLPVQITRPPQPVFLARDCDHDFVEMPDVTTVWCLAP